MKKIMIIAALVIIDSTVNAQNVRSIKINDSTYVDPSFAAISYETNFEAEVKKQDYFNGPISQKAAPMPMEDATELSNGLIAKRQDWLIKDGPNLILIGKKAKIEKIMVIQWKDQRWRKSYVSAAINDLDQKARIFSYYE